MEQPRKIVPPVYLLLALIAMVALHLLAPLATLVSPPYTYIGLAPIAAGVALGAAAVRAFSKARTPVVPFERSTVLITEGSYRYTRNPMYLGLVLILVGTWLLLGTLSALLPIVPFVWIIQVNFIRGEERFLEEIFGARYLEYKRRVRRWI